MVQLLPRRGERPLSDLYAELAQELTNAADTLSRVLGHTSRERDRIVPRLHENASRATEISARIATRLADSLITPFEAELLYDLALTLADAIDAMEHMAETLVGNRVGPLPSPLLEGAKLIERGAALTTEATWVLRRLEKLGDFYPRMRRLRRQGDRLCRQAMSDVCRRGGAANELLPLYDAVTAMREIFALMERSARLTDLLRVKDS